jgi:outer membrane biosynthesis protein TonB
MTELAAPQISSLMEALPGIAAVLRSPVASAIVALSRAGAGLEEFRPADAEELLRYGVRRNLLTEEEVERVIQEVEEAMGRKPAKAPKAAVAEKPNKAPTPAKKPAAPAARKAPAKAAPVKTPPPAAKAKAKSAPVKAQARKAAPASKKAAAKGSSKASAKPAARKAVVKHR